MRPLLPLALALLPACSAPEGPPAKAQFVMSTLTFARAEEGISSGFDLDGHVSDATDPVGCAQEDFTGPDGTPGVDNATARLMPFLDLTEAVALEPLVQQAINSGELLLVVELIGLDDPTDDDSVDVNLVRGVGEPFVGTDGLLEAGQTFDRSAEVEESRVDGVAVVDGTLEARGFDVHLPLQVFDTALDVNLEHAALRAVHDAATDRWSGTVAGTFAYDGLLETLLDADIDQALKDALPGLLDSLADLDPGPDGACTKLSATLDFQGVPSWFYEDAPE